MVSGTSGWVSWMSSATRCVSGVFFAGGSNTYVFGANGSDKSGSGADGSVSGSGLGSGGGDGEW